MPATDSNPSALRWWTAALAGASLATTAILWPNLPETIVVHWNVAGEPVGFAGRWVAVCTALLSPVLYGLMMIVPRFDRQLEPHNDARGDAGDSSGNDAGKVSTSAYQVVSTTIALVAIVVHWTIVLVSLGTPMRSDIVMRAVVGVLLMVIGTALTRARPSWFFGIRTPWTLSNARVWRKTHRAGGRGLGLTGLVFLVMAPWRSELSYWVPMGTMVVVMVATIGYSYLLYRKIERPGVDIGS